MTDQPRCIECQRFLVYEPFAIGSQGEIFCSWDHKAANEKRVGAAMEVIARIKGENDMDPVETMIRLIAHTCNGEFADALEVIQDLEEWYDKDGYRPTVEAVAQALAYRSGIASDGSRVGGRNKK